jgi:3-deoxy-manno-octulosonate cytidylyltransferase (CMP-KDO synthetase)
MRILCVIPSRIHSTRLPRKALLPIRGKPMIQWVYESARNASFLTDVVVATDSDEIADIIHQVGGKFVMTDPHIPTGSDRCAVVSEQFSDMDVIINLQGDEPFVQPSMLQQLVQPYLDGETPDMTTLAYPFNPDFHAEPGSVKVITDLQQNALYFSRAPIPYFRVEHSAPVYQHIGLYAYRREFLLHYRQFF